MNIPRRTRCRPNFAAGLGRRQFLVPLSSTGLEISAATPSLPPIGRGRLTRIDLEFSQNFAVLPANVPSGCMEFPGGLQNSISCEHGQQFGELIRASQAQTVQVRPARKSLPTPTGRYQRNPFVVAAAGRSFVPEPLCEYEVRSALLSTGRPVRRRSEPVATDPQTKAFPRHGISPMRGTLQHSIMGFGLLLPRVNHSLLEMRFSRPPNRISKIIS